MVTLRRYRELAGHDDQTLREAGMEPPIAHFVSLGQPGAGSTAQRAAGPRESAIPANLFFAASHRGVLELKPRPDKIMTYIQPIKNLREYNRSTPGYY
jgi:hypothetical protein